MPLSDQDSCAPSPLVEQRRQMTRRAFLGSATGSLGAAALGSMLGPQALGGDDVTQCAMRVTRS